MACLIAQGGFKMNENQVRLLREAIRLINRRSVDPRRTVEQRMSYSSALNILRYALEGNAECMYQFDDVQLHCDECGRIDSDDPTDIQFCNACENHEFFQPWKENVK